MEPRLSNDARVLHSPVRFTNLVMRWALRMNRIAPTPPRGAPGRTGAPGDVTIGEWDLGSVMNYRNPHWTGDGRLSAVDIEGVRRVR